MTSSVDAAPAELGFNSEHRLRAENLPFDIDVWYPRLKQFTYETTFLPLTRAEALSIVHSYCVNWRSFVPSTLTTGDVHALQALEVRIDEALSSPPFMGSAFLRCCGRSPKDGEPLDREDVWQRYGRNLDTVRAEVKSFAEEDEAPSDVSATRKETIEAILVSEGNAKLIAASRTATLCVRSGAEALALLLSSERIYSDCRDWLAFGEPEQLVLRRWDPQMRLEDEFRVFVYKGRLVAISQYDHYAVYPWLAFARQDQKDAMIESMSRFWERLHPFVGVSSYCADFACVGSRGGSLSFDVTLVELSPFSPCTGPALFHWERDATLLRPPPPPPPAGDDDDNGGQRKNHPPPPQLRLNEAVRPQIDELVELTWEDRFSSQAVPRYDAHWRQVLESAAAAAEQPTVTTMNAVVAALFKGPVLALAVPPAVFLWFSSSFDQAKHFSAIVCAVLLVGAAIATSAWSQAKEHEQEEDKEKQPVRRTELLFTYGTLKRGFHWHGKFLSRCRFAGVATTSAAVPLVLGASGVPYCLYFEDDQQGQGSDSSSSCSASPQRVTGELFEVDAQALQGMDSYEGVTKGHYVRKRIEVEVDEEEEEEEDGGGSSVSSGKRKREAWIYLKARCSDELRNGPFLRQYSRNTHEEQYRPIEHILVKQQGYLDGEISTWGLVDQAFNVYGQAKS